MPSFSAASLEMRCIFAFCAISMSDGMMVSAMVFGIMEQNIGTHARCSLDAGQELPKRCARQSRCCRAAKLGGREPVRADHRLRTDDEPIRTQSAILYKSLTPPVLLSITMFMVRMVFIRTKTWLARATRKSARGT